MTDEQRALTIERFRLHGFGLEQAIMMCEAIAFAFESKDFATKVGRFGIKHLQDAVESMRLN